MILELERGPDLCLSSAIDFLLVLITSFYPLSIFLYHALYSKIVPILWLPVGFNQYNVLSSVQLLSRVQLCDPMNHSTPGLPVHHKLPEFTQIHAHRVGDAIQPSHPVIPFSSCPQSLPASGSFPMSQLFA